jgi:hypothetical protein
MKEVSVMESEHKVWVKININPSTDKILKRVALDTDKYRYQVLDDMCKIAYPEYFTEN